VAPSLIDLSFSFAIIRARFGEGLCCRLLPGHGCDQREICLRAAANNALSVSLAVAAAAMPSVASAADLNLIPHWPVVAANVVVFGLLIYPVNRLLIAPLLRLVDEREHRTSGALAEAGELDGEANELGAQIEAGLLEARARAQARRAAIMADAEGQERAILDAASAEATRSIEVVRTSIASDSSAARATLQADSRSLAQEAAARLLGRPL
jgi:F-type H+-transporting ATPase subunit b